MVKSAKAKRTFHGYTARGAGLDYISDDGTIAPTAAGGSIAFAPEIVIPALQTMKQRYGKHIYDQYGFVDAFNPSFHTKTELRTGKLVPELGWVDTVQLGIDQGPILLMIENWRDDFVWNVMKKNPYIRKGLERAGFTGGWLQKGAGHAVSPARAPARQGMAAERAAPPRRGRAGARAGCCWAAVPAARDPHTLTFWTFGREGEAVQALLPAFERAHPGIRVECSSCR